MRKTILLATVFCAFASFAHAQYAEPVYSPRPMYAQPVYRQPVPQDTYRPVDATGSTQYGSTAKYRAANPMYQLGAGRFMSDTRADYIVIPKDKDAGTEKVTGWDAAQQFSYGLTDRLSMSLQADYMDLKGKDSKDRLKNYGVNLGVQYHLVRTDFFDMKMGIDGRIYKTELKPKGMKKEDVRFSYVAPFVTLGAKVENVTPYIRMSYVSSLWSEEDAGNYYVVRPGIYIDVNQYLGFDICLENMEDTQTAYAASADFYASQNVVISLQGSLVAPKDDADEYTIGANVKFVF